jgi:hypothetical protein
MQMKKKVRLIAPGAIALCLAAPVWGAEFLLNNPDFEEGPNCEGCGAFEIPGWFNLAAWTGGEAIIGAPAAGPQQGTKALRLAITDPSQVVVFAFQRLFINENLAASPGDEFYASVRVLREDLPANDDFSAGLLALAFFGATPGENDIQDMAPEQISKGQMGECPFPSINAPFEDTENLGTWQQLQSQGVAASADSILIDCLVKIPEDAQEVGLFLFNINTTGAPAPIWFDNAILARLQPDDDGDRIENGVDDDPINVSVDFGDGVTSGSVLSDPDGILAIDDAADPVAGVSIVSDPGNASAARIRVCDSLASLRVRPNSALEVTCGSVVLNVAEGSEPVDLEILIDGEPAVLTVPANNLVTYEDESEEILVDGSSSGEPVTFTQGETVIEIAAGETLEVPSVQIDIKPGSADNCFNVNGNGVIPVAVLGSATLDVNDIDVNTLSFAGLNVRARGNDTLSCGTEDVNADGFVDLVCQFVDAPDAWTPGSGFATLSGLLIDGSEFNGSDAICIVP